MNDLDPKGLLPCPFCGSEPRVSHYETESLWSHDQVTYTKVECPECEISFQTEPGYEVEAPEAWNRRHLSATVPAGDGELVERLEAQAVAIGEYRSSRTVTASLLLEAASRLSQGTGDSECVKALEEENRQITDLMLMADRFKVGEMRGSPVHVVTRGPGQWAVSDGSFVLSNAGEWEAEPFPSNRSDEFIARTRFTFAEAIRRAKEALSGDTL